MNMNKEHFYDKILILLLMINLLIQFIVSGASLISILSCIFMLSLQLLSIIEMIRKK